MSRSLRLSTRSPSGPALPMARTPSNLISNAHPGPEPVETGPGGGHRWRDQPDPAMPVSRGRWAIPHSRRREHPTGADPGPLTRPMRYPLQDKRQYAGGASGGRRADPTSAADPAAARREACHVRGVRVGVGTLGGVACTGRHAHSGGGSRLGSGGTLVSPKIESEIRRWRCSRVPRTCDPPAPAPLLHAGRRRATRAGAAL